MRKFLCLFFTAAFVAFSISSFNVPFLAEKKAIASLPAFTEYSIAPKVTDNTIDNWLANHYVAINKSRRARKKLFVFFPGSGAEPNNYHLIIQQAANNGYRAIGLQYPNTPTLVELCAQSSDADCFEKVRLEILNGVDWSDKISVNYSNSLKNRLIKLLVYLHAQHPDEGWLNYLNGNAIKWSSVIVAGHSQGGAQAALIAKKHRVSRVAMFSAPGEHSGALRAYAPWLSAPSATPNEKYYGFNHVNDFASNAVLPAWKIMGMDAYGAIVNVDSTLPPYNGSRRLTTAARPARIDDKANHNSVVVDVFTPKLADGTPLFKDVWQYLCFSPSVYQR